METKKDLKLAILIDADNVPYANVKEMFEEIAKLWNANFQANLCRLDQTNGFRMEKCTFRKRDNTSTTIQLYVRQKLFGQCIDY